MFSSKSGQKVVSVATHLALSSLTLNASGVS